MKKIGLLILVLVLFSLNLVGGFTSAVAIYPLARYQSITHEGDIIVDSDEAFTIEDSNFTIAGSIIVKDDARLLIRNANLTLTAFGNHRHYIIVQDEAMVNLTNSKINLGVGSMLFQNSSEIYINNSTILTEDLGSLNQISFRDNSVAHIWRSRTDCLFYAHHNSLVYIDESNIRSLSPGAYVREGNITIQVRESHIDHLKAKQSNINIWNSTIGSVWSEDSYIYIEDSKIQSSLHAEGDSEILLIHTSIPQRSVSTRNSSVVLVTYDLLPFVVLPYQWVSWINFSIIIAVISSVGLILHYTRKRKIRQSLKAIA